MTETDLEALHNLDWKSFEDFVVAVFQELYKPHQMRVVHTEYTGDGGRDGWAEAIIGPQGSSSLKSPLFRLWIEAKKRQVGNSLDLGDVGGHVMLALQENVNHLVFVTNVDFRPRVYRVLDELGRRNNFATSLICGSELLAEAKRCGIEPPKHSAAARSKKVSADALQQTPRRSEPQITVKASFSSDPLTQVPELGENTLVIDLDTAVFVVLDIIVEGGSGISSVHVKLEARDPSTVTVKPYSIPSCPILSCSSRARLIYVIWPHRAGDIKFDNFNIVLDNSQGSAVNIQASGSIRVRERLLSPWAPPSREAILKQLKDSVEAWINGGGFESMALVADAGAGKSYILVQLRQHWLSQQAKEICLDGAIHATPTAVAERILETLFPLPDDLVDLQTDEDIRLWLESLGIRGEVTLARIISLLRAKPRDLSYLSGITQLGELSSILLSRASVGHRVVLVFEDLHKVDPLVLRLLVEIQRFTRFVGKANLLIITTSRPAPSVAGQDNIIQWLHGYQSYADLGVVEKYMLPSLDEDEAIDLICRTIPTLARNSAQEIIQQVGKTPFGIKEGLLFLIAEDIVRLDAQVRQYIVPRRELLSARIRARDLERATALKLGAIRARHGEWLADVIDAAACLGRYFDLENCLTVASKAPSLETDLALRDCELFDIIRPSALSPSLCEFEHDIVRLVALENMGAFRLRRLSGLLYRQLRDQADEFAAATLAYQAGLARNCIDHAHHDMQEALARKQYSRALKDTFLELMVTDAISNWHALFVSSGLMRWDDTFKLSGPPSLQATQNSTRAADVLALLRRALEYMNLVGCIASSVSDRLISSACMIAATLEDRRASAELAFYEGRMLFDRNRLQDALDMFRNAEKILQENSATQDRGKRSTNMMWVSFVERQLGRTEDSYASMRRALALRQGADWGLLGRVLANCGALFLHSDLRTTRSYWERGLKAMRRARASSRDAEINYAHFLTNVSHLDMLEGNFSSSEALLLESTQIARKLEIDEELIRCYIQGGCLEVCRGADLVLAERFLKEAESLAISQGSFRKLWRIRANLATVKECEQDWTNAYIYDLAVVESIPPIMPEYQAGESSRMWSRTRATCALANIALRVARNDSYSVLLDRIDSRSRDILSYVAGHVNSSPRGRSIGLVRNFCRKIGGEFRFIVTD